LDLKIWKRKKKKKRKNREEEPTVDGIRVPKEWLKGKRGKKLKSEFVVVKAKKRKKYRIPHLRLIKRIIVGLGLVFNFLASQLLLFGGSFESKMMGFVFLFQAYICLDYLWQTRYDMEVLRRVLRAEKKVKE